MRSKFLISRSEDSGSGVSEMAGIILLPGNKSKFQEKGKKLVKLSSPVIFMLCDKHLNVIVIMIMMSFPGVGRGR